MQLIPHITRREIHTYQSTQMMEVLLEVLSNRSTGSLTINFSGGKPSGTIEWNPQVQQVCKRK